MIEVEVSNGKGKEMVKMPNIIGKTPDEANALLANEGLAAAVPVFEETTEIAQNLVFWQQYPEGTELERVRKSSTRSARASSLPAAATEPM